MVRILIGGDICPTKKDIHYFIQGESEKIFDDLLEEIHKSDLIVANLETPLIEKQTPILKSGSNFGVPSRAVHGIKNAGINLLNLANNHILDHGEEGLLNTIQTLNRHNIRYIGAGRNINEASEPYFQTISNKNICILSYAEHEHSIATKYTAGANPLSIIDFSKRIIQLRKECDFIILLYHGGKEYYFYPTPNQKELMEYFVDMGVNVIVCQHSHVPGAIQKYKNGVIIYGQGNFVFDPYPHKNTFLYQGYLVKIEVISNSSFHFEKIPYYHKSLMNSSLSGIKKMEGAQKQSLIEFIDEKSTKITEQYISEEWNKFCQKNEILYLSILKGQNRILRKMFVKIPFIKKLLYSKKEKIVIKNIISCETHREALLTILKQNVL